MSLTTWGPASDALPRVRVRCQCCRQRPQTLGEVSEGKVYIRGQFWDVAELRRVCHWVWRDAGTLADIGTAQPLRCDCCVPEIGRMLAEFQDGLLIIRGRRHGRLHFVALTPLRLETLLAEAGQMAYA